MEEEALFAGCVLAFVLGILFILLSGGCGVTWETVHGDVHYTDSGEVQSRTVVIKEDPGWLWFFWGNKLVVWTHVPTAHGDMSNPVWRSSYGHTEHSRVETHWTAWYGQQSGLRDINWQTDLDAALLKRALDLMERERE